MHSDDFFDRVDDDGLEALPIAWDSSEPALSFAYISQSGSIRLEAPAMAIPFGDEPLLTEDLRLEHGRIHMTQPGIYYATFALSTPPDLAADATIRLLLDDRDAPAAIYHIMRPRIPGPGISFTAQAVFEMDGPCTLCVTCSEPLKFTAGAPDVIIASLALLRVWRPRE